MQPIDTIPYRGYKIKVFIDEDPLNPSTEWDNAGTYVLSCGERELATINTEENANIWAAMIKAGEEIDKFKARIRRQGGAVVEWSGSPHVDGFAYSRHEEVQEEWNGDVEAAERYLKAHIETLAAYCNGEIYGYVVERGSYYDSCWGYYGDDGLKSMVEEAKGNIDHRRQELRESRRFHGLSFSI